MKKNFLNKYITKSSLPWLFQAKQGQSPVSTLLTSGIQLTPKLCPLQSHFNLDFPVNCGNHFPVKRVRGGGVEGVGVSLQSPREGKFNLLLLCQLLTFLSMLVYTTHPYLWHKSTREREISKISIYIYIFLFFSSCDKNGVEVTVLGSQAGMQEIPIHSFPAKWGSES